MIEAQTEAWKASGLVEVVEWQVASNACQYCQAMGGKRWKRRKIGNAFVAQGTVLTGTKGGKMLVDYADVLGPPLHPNCRCDLMPIISR